MMNANRSTAKSSGEDHIENLVRQMKKSSNTAVYNAMVALRSKFLKEDDGVSRFRQYGGIQLLLYHIQKPNAKIVEIALSILGNCSLEPETRSVIRRLDGIPHIVRILDTLESESALNRACRALANLAMDVLNAEEMHKRNAAQSIIRLLLASKDSLFKQSACRALRILATAAQHRDKISEHGGVDCLGKLLIARDADPEVMQGVLRALATLTTNCTAECARQMQNVEYLEKLVASASTESLRETSLHVLANLSRQETIRPALGSAGIVPVLINQVAKWETSSSGWQWAVDALCLCTREAVNRVRVRDDGGLNYILSLFKEQNDERLWLCSLASMVNFIYDDLGYATLVELGMVSALVERFKTLVSKEKKRTHVSTSRSPSPRLVEDGQDDNAISFLDFGEDGCRRDISRQRSFQSACTSPDCSPPYWTSFPFTSTGASSPAATSPKSHSSPNQNPTVDEFCYSPVYEWSNSEDELSIEDSRSSRETISGLGPDSPSLSLEKTENDGKDGYDSDKDLLNTDATERSPLGDILLLLSRHSLQENPCPSFLKSGAFLAILDYVTSVENPLPRAKRCLSRIVRNPLCFEDLILDRIPSYLYQNFVETEHVITRCPVCSVSSELALSLLTDLRLQAESSFGSGCLLHLLLGKTEQDQKLSAALAAAYLLRSPAVRKRLFLDSVGFTALMKSMEDTGSADFDDAWKGLVHFARTVIVPLDEDCDNSAGPTKSICRYAEQKTSPETDVQFCVTGDTETIPVNREVLCSQSDVFEAMMRGSFLESRQQTIHLQDSSFRAVEYMVHCLYSCLPPVCPALRVASQSASFLLEVLTLSDKFLLHGLRDLVTQQIMNCKMNNEELGNTLAHAKLLNIECLREWVLTHLLVSTLESYEAKRQQLLKLLDCDENLLEDCRVFLTSLLTAQMLCF